jgi:hypothetical protein
VRLVTKRALLLAMCLVASAFPRAARAQSILTFEDLFGRDSRTPMPLNYGGIAWSSDFWAWTRTPIDCADASHDCGYPAASGAVVLATNLTSFSVTPREVFFDLLAPASFLGASISGVAALGDMHFDLYDGSALVAASPALTPNGSSARFLASGYDGMVTRVGVVGPTGFYVLDDLTFATLATTVPEPATLALLAIGLAALAGRAAITRRRA